MDSFLKLPARATKPREFGVTSLIDSGLSLDRFRDVVKSFGRYIDIIKFGWGTALVSDCLSEKLACAREHQVDVHFGGSLFEKALVQGRLDEFRRFLRAAGCRYVEISNGCIQLSNEEKCRHIREFSGEFEVLSEVGYKDSQRSLELHPARWIEYIHQDLEAGAIRVIAEARESGRSGICRADGEIRFGLIAEVLDSSIDPDRLIFEAPNKELQVYFIRKLGPNANLANVAFTDVAALETLRLGLRSDTLLDFEESDAPD